MGSTDDVEVEAPDGTKFRGNLDSVMRAVERYRAFLATRALSPSPMAAANNATSITRQSAVQPPPVEPSEPPAPQTPEFLLAAKGRLWLFFDKDPTRAFRTADAIAVWADKRLWSKNDDGSASIEYQRAWAEVTKLIMDYAAEHDLAVRRFRAGRGSAYKFIPKAEALPTDLLGPTAAAVGTLSGEEEQLS